MRDLHFNLNQTCPAGTLGLAKRRPTGKVSNRRSASELRFRKVPDEDFWELLHPRCAIERADDIEEVEAMIQGGEIDIALEELRWLLSGCPQFIQGHRMLGELALRSGDMQLARAHFGYAFQAGAEAWKKAGRPVPLPFHHDANRDFFKSGQRLIECLVQLNKQKMAREVADVMMRCDPTDPLGVKDAL